MKLNKTSHKSAPGLIWPGACFLEIKWLCLLTAIGAYFCGTGNSRAKRLFLCSAPIRLILIGGELSWGRVFYPNGKGGFLPLKQLWYRQYVYPGIAIVLALIVTYMIKNDLHKELVYWLKR